MLRQRPDLFCALLTAGMGGILSASSAPDTEKRTLYIVVFSVLGIITAIFALMISKEMTKTETELTNKTEELKSVKGDVEILRKLTDELQRRLLER